MKRLFLIAWALVVPCSVSFAQTHSSVQGHWFPPPEVKWQTLPFRTEVATNPSPDPANAFLIQKSREGNPPDMAVFSRIGREGLLKLPGPKYNTDFERKLGAAFEPKIFHRRHSEIECSITTAIARKNPLVTVHGVKRIILE